MRKLLPSIGPTSSRQRRWVNGTLLFVLVLIVVVGIIKLMSTDDLTDAPKASDVKTNLTTGAKTNASNQGGLIVREGRPSFQFATGKPPEVVSLEQFKSMQEKQKANRQVAGAVK